MRTRSTSGGLGGLGGRADAKIAQSASALAVGYIIAFVAS